MKRRFIGVVVLAMMLGLCGCGNKDVADMNMVENEVADEGRGDLIEDEEQVADEADTQEAIDAAIENDVVEDTSEQTEENKDTEVKEVKVYTSEELANMSSPDFAKILEFGWNLGNTFDANATGGLEAETSWGQPKTTKELISYVKEVGFTSIRIPISWGKHTDSEYNIDEEWMARVKEVVDYAYDEGLFVIINSHHDNDYYYPSSENAANAEKYLTTIWAQIAEEFKDYDNHLIFESMNEPRLAGTDIEWWFAAADPTGKAAIEQICKLNQAFVDTVRATGGNNEGRFLMVPSYAASQDFALNNSFSMPEDPSNKLMLSVHAYTPYDFAGKADGYKEWDGSKNSEFVFMGKLMSKFIVEGYGVVIGEFGATNKGNDKDRASWARAYTMKAASYGISYFVWDNGATGVGEENFGVIDRRNLKLYFPELFDAYMCGYPKN